MCYYIKNNAKLNACISLTEEDLIFISVGRIFTREYRLYYFWDKCTEYSSAISIYFYL